jgi:2'-5' RNA ligase
VSVQLPEYQSSKEVTAQAVEAAKPKPAPPPPKAPSAAHHNRVLKAGYARADELEARMVRVLTPILTRAGRDAAKNFTATATNHLAASARREADRDALVGLAPAEARSLIASLALNAAGQDIASNSTMIAVKMTPEQATAIAAQGGLDADTLHVTLAYLGEVDGPLDSIAAALRIVAGEHAPLSGVVGGYGAFEPPGMGILLPDVPGLVELRVAVTQALVKAGIEYGRDHGFEAHVSVITEEQAQAADTNDDYPSSVCGSPLTFSELLIVRGDVEVVALPFTGALPLTAAAKPPPSVTPEELKARTQAVEDAKAELRTRLSDGSDAAAVEAAKADLRAAQSNLYVASSKNPVWSAPAPAEVLDVDALVLALRTKTEPVRVAMVESVTKASIEGAGVSFDVSNPYVDAVIKDTASQIPAIAATTQANVVKVISASYSQGLSVPDTAKAIQVAMQEQSYTRAVLISRTTLAGATAGGSLAATKAINAATGGNTSYSKVWMTAGGAVHPRHEDYDGLDGQTQPLDGSFEVGDAQLQFPGDPSGPPEEICNCL